MQLDHFDNVSFYRGRPWGIEIVWILIQSVLVGSWFPGSRYRVWLLRLFGARIGVGVVIKPGLRVKFPWRLIVGDHTWLGEDLWIDNLVNVEIGANCCISQGAYLCTGSHDWNKPTFDLIVKPIRIEDAAWVAARAVVAPGVTIGKGAVLSLGSVATADLLPWTIYQGCPAKPCRRRKAGPPRKSGPSTE